MITITKNGRKLSVDVDRVAYGAPLFEVVVRDAADSIVSKQFVNAYSRSHALSIAIDGRR